jgi:hypothetical protein
MFMSILYLSFFNIPLNVRDGNIYGSQLLMFYYLINDCLYQYS